MRVGASRSTDRAPNADLGGQGRPPKGGAGTPSESCLVFPIQETDEQERAWIFRENSSGLLKEKMGDGRVRLECRMQAMGLVHEGWISLKPGFLVSVFLWGFCCCCFA